MSSKIECTAVNELIDLVQQKPMARDSGVELLFQPPREANLRRQVDGTPAPRGLWAVELPVEPTEARATMPTIPTRKPEFEPTPRVDENARRSARAQRAETDIPLTLKKFGVPAGILVMVGIGVGAAVSLSRHRETGTPIDHVVAFTPPKIVVAPPPPPSAVKPAFVDVMLASNPPGASATLLDNSTGASTPLGSTPVEASLDPTKQYDVRFELAGHRATTQHLDPASSHKLEVALAEPEPTTTDSGADATPAPAPTGKHHRRHQTAAKKAATKRVATAPAARHAKGDDGGISALAAASTARKDAKQSDAPGILSITTSVPCAILLDGANTGKTTPTKMSVPAGHHSIRLIAATQHINKQISVDVAPKKTTKLFQSF
ncbi:MAG: PEGA domain-containing protein [Deltaproteobacteria bacterium]